MPSKIIYHSVICGIAIALGLSSNALAKNEKDVIISLQKCQLIQEDNSRLTCFDKAVSELTGAVKSKDILVIDKSEIVEAQEDSFGKNQDATTQLQKIIEKEKLESEVETQKELVSIISKVEKRSNNRLRFHLENGQIWDQIESKLISVSKKKQSAAHIKKAAFGSFRLRINGKGSPIRVKRIK